MIIESHQNGLFQEPRDMILTSRMALGKMVDHDHDHCHPKMLDCRSMCNFVQNSRVRYIPYMVASITFKYKI